MIKNYNPRPFERYSALPSYVTITDEYELLGQTKTGYIIRFAKLTIGKSNSAGNPLTHVLFESFSDHGERMVVTRTRVGGQGGEFIAVLNAMMDAGIEFESVIPCHFETLLTALGALIQAKNPDISKYEIVS